MSFGIQIAFNTKAMQLIYDLPKKQNEIHLLEITVLTHYLNILSRLLPFFIELFDVY